MNLPMPNEDFDDGKVIASHYFTDAEAELILLMPEPPFYRRVTVYLPTGIVTCRNRFENISEAIDGWEE